MDKDRITSLEKRGEEGKKKKKKGIEGIKKKRRMDEEKKGEIHSFSKVKKEAAGGSIDD